MNMKTEKNVHMLRLSGSVMALFVYFDYWEFSHMGYDIGENDIKQLMFSPEVNRHVVNINEFHSKEFIDEAVEGTGQNTYNLLPIVGIPYETFEQQRSNDKSIFTQIPLATTAEIRRKICSVDKKEILYQDMMCCTSIQSYERFRMDDNDKVREELFFTWIQQFEEFDLREKQDMIRFASQLGISNFSYKESQSYECNYGSLHREFKKKFNVNIAFLDGNHRMLLFTYLLHGIAIDDSIYQDESKVRQLNRKTSPIFDKFDVRLYLPKQSFPTLLECKNFSFEIYRAESLNLHNKIRDLIVELIRAQKYTRDINDLPVFSSKTWRRESDNNTILKDDFLLQCRNYFLPVY